VRSHDKLEVVVRRVSGGRAKLWLFVRTRNGDPEWVPSFEDWFRMIKALCYCEEKKYPFLADPVELPRSFFERCFNAELRAMEHDEAWAKLRQEFKL
jgi:hypothetical protein